MTTRGRGNRPVASAELAFVLACAAPPGREASDDASPVLDRDRLDHARVAAIAHRHQVIPLVVERYRRDGGTVPAAVSDRFDPVAPLRLAREAIRLRDLLADAGISVLFLKGSALAVLAYGSITRRQFSDIDLLVMAGDTARAASVLSEAGYREPTGSAADLADRVLQLLPIAKDIALRHPDSGHIVELHWRLSDNPRAAPVWGREPIQWVDLSPGAAVPTLGIEPLFAYLCGHGASHFWARLRWLADVASLLAQEADRGDRLWRAAVARGQGRAAASAIVLAEQLLGVPPPPSFVRPQSLRLTLLVWGAERTIRSGGGATELARTGWRGWAETAGKLLIASSVGDLKGWTMRLLYSPSDIDLVGRSRLRHVLHPLLRVPRLLRRRRRRRRSVLARDHLPRR